MIFIIAGIIVTLTIGMLLKVESSTPQVAILPDIWRKNPKWKK
jgi:hypothetical protein